MIADPDSDAGEAAAAALHGRGLELVSAARCDVKRGADVKAVVDDIVARHGRLDVLFTTRTPESYRELPNEAHPIGRIGLPSEAAAAVAFLASDDASFVTGVLLPVGGGYAAQ